MLDKDKMYNPVAQIKIIGVGGGGNNSVKSLLNTNLEGIEFIIANTDSQVLNQFDQKQTLFLGDNKRGIGAGANPEIGKKAAEESKDDIKNRLKNTDLVIITAGMGGGTGTGASPVIAKIAKECGALVVAIVTTPFGFEGPKRSKIAKQGIEEIKKHVDAYIVISNDKLLDKYGDIAFNDAFICANNVLKQTIRTLIDIIALPGIINLDFADLETVIKNKGEAVVGIGSAAGEDRAIKAINSAITSPILESSIIGASDAIVYFSASNTVTLKEINTAMDTMRQIVGGEINIIFGLNNNTSEDSNKLGELFVSVIATGLPKDSIRDSEGIKQEVRDKIANLTISYENENTKEMLLNTSSFGGLDFGSDMDDDLDSNVDMADILKP